MIHIANPSPCRLPAPCMANSNSISQFVAVRGTRENSHPFCEGRSAASRIYLDAAQRLDNLVVCSYRALTCPILLLCLPRSQTIDLTCPSLDTAAPRVSLSIASGRGEQFRDRQGVQLGSLQRTDCAFVAGLQVSIQEPNVARVIAAYRYAFDLRISLHGSSCAHHRTSHQA